uniref:Uncharacterized protein n=1 Tax=Cannabis sativa TaxID=3483 RepID=A0A803QJA1_CANSA
MGEKLGVFVVGSSMKEGELISDDELDGGGLLLMWKAILEVSIESSLRFHIDSIIRNTNDVPTKVTDEINLARMALFTEDDCGAGSERFEEFAFAAMHVLPLRLGIEPFVGPLQWILLDAEEFTYGAIVSGDMDMLVLVWDLRTGEKVHTLKGHQLQVTGLALDNGDIVSSSID